MKKIFLNLAIIAFIMLGTISVAKATTFYVNITLSDTCSPSPYHGYYCVQLSLYYDTKYICTAQNCTITGSGCYAFSCDVGPILEEPLYKIVMVAAARYPGGTCSTTTGVGSSGSYWNDLADSGCPAGGGTLSITL